MVLKMGTHEHYLAQGTAVLVLRMTGIATDNRVWVVHGGGASL